MHESSIVSDLVVGVIVLLLIGAVILAVTKRLKLPFTVVLVLAGIGLSLLADAYPAFFGPIHQLEISPHLIFYVFLPTLIFESAFNLDARELGRDLGAVLTLAIPGLLLSTALIGGMIGYFTAIPYPAAFLLGAILSATDPVSVIALFKQLGAPKRLSVLVEGESLLNDATAIVVSLILVEVVRQGGAVSAETVAGGIVKFFKLFAGGLLVGWALGLLTGYVLGEVEADPFIEITLTTILAYLSFILAEEVFHVSGIMATMAAGITLGSWGRMKVSPSVRHYLEHFWEYIAFIANTLIFLMVGLLVELTALWVNLGLLCLVIFSMLISRAVVIYSLIPLVSRLKVMEPVGLAYQTVMYWGGLRGAIALAIVLSLPHFDESETFVALVMGVVLFTLLVQGMSIEYVMRWLGLSESPLLDRLEIVEVYLSAKQRALRRIGQLMAGGLFSGPIAARLKSDCDSEIDELQSSLEKLRETELDRAQERQLLYLRGFSEEKSLFIELFSKGHLSERAFRELMRVLTLQIENMRFKGALRHVRVRDLKGRRLEIALSYLLDRMPGFASLSERLRVERVAMNYQEAWGLFQGSSRVLERLDELVQHESIPAEIVEEVRGLYEEWQVNERKHLDQVTEQFPEFVNAMQERLGKRMILLAEAETAEEHAEHGTLPKGVAEEIHLNTERKLRALRGHVITELRIEPTELLRKVPCFQGIPSEEFPNIASRLRARTVGENEDIIRQGEEGHSLYLIARGVVRVSHEDDGGIRDLATLMAGDFFGEMALLHPQPRTASVRSVTPCSLYQLNRDDLATTMDAYPAIRQSLEDADRQRKAEIDRV